MQKRRARFLDSMPRTKCSHSSDIKYGTVNIPEMTLAHTPSNVSESNGSLPVTTPYMTTPSDQMSMSGPT